MLINWITWVTISSYLLFSSLAFILTPNFGCHPNYNLAYLFAISTSKLGCYLYLLRFVYSCLSLRYWSLYQAVAHSLQIWSMLFSIVIYVAIVFVLVRTKTFLLPIINVRIFFLLLIILRLHIFIFLEWIVWNHIHVIQRTVWYCY